MTSFLFKPTPLQLKIYFLCVLCIGLSCCGFKLKQASALNETLDAVSIVEQDIDPNFINLLEKNLQQSQVRISPLASTQLTILNYQEQRHAVSVDTRNARQTETRITKTLKFSLNSKQNGLIIEPSTISRSREYINDNNNIGGKASEERILQKALDKEIIVLLLRRLESVSISETSVDTDTNNNSKENTTNQQ